MRSMVGGVRVKRHRLTDQEPHPSAAGSAACIHPPRFGEGKTKGSCSKSVQAVAALNGPRRDACFHGQYPNLAILRCEGAARASKSQPPDLIGGPTASGLIGRRKSAGFWRKRITVPPER